MFGSSLFHSLATCGKKVFWNIRFYKKLCEKCWDVICGSILRIYMMVVRLKEFYRANTIASSIFFVVALKARFSIQLITREALNDPSYFYCRVILHWFNFVWKWCIGRVVIYYIIKLLHGKIGCNLKGNPIPFVTLLLLFLVYSLNESLLSSRMTRCFCIFLNLTTALIKQRVDPYLLSVRCICFNLKNCFVSISRGRF